MERISWKELGSVVFSKRETGYKKLWLHRQCSGTGNLYRDAVKSSLAAHAEKVIFIYMTTEWYFTWNIQHAVVWMEVSYTDIRILNSLLQHTNYSQKSTKCNLLQNSCIFPHHNNTDKRTE